MRFLAGKGTEFHLRRKKIVSPAIPCRHFGIGLALILAAVVCLPACRSSARAKEHVEKANQYVAQKQFTEARAEYREAIRIAPDLADAHYRLGLLELQQEHPTAALQSLTRSVELDPRNTDARLRLGNLLVSATQYKDASSQANAVLASDASNAAAHRLLGQIFLQQRQYLPAERELQLAISLAPRDPQSFEDLGLAQMLDAEYGAAERSFQAAVDLAPADPQTYINLASFYKAQEAPDRAESALRGGMTHNPHAVELPIALAGLYAEHGRAADAKRILDQLETDTSNFPDGRRAVAEFYLTNGDPAAALDRYRALAEKDPRDHAAATKTAECYLQLEEWQEAIAWIDAHGKDALDRDDPDFRLLRARADLGAFRLRDALNELQALIQDSPDTAAVYYYLAQVHLRQEEPAPAQQAFIDALRVQPGYLPAVLGLGNISLQQGNPEVALSYAGQVIAGSFWLADAHLLAGSALLARNDPDQAQHAFEIAAGLNPRSPEAQERLGKALSVQGKYSDAEKAYEASLALAPDYAPALGGLADVLVKQGKARQAAARIDRQISAHPKAYQLQVAKAEFCITQKDWSCAERSYNQALTLNPYYINGYLALAHVYAATNRADAMIREYQNAIAKFPDYLPTYILLGQVYAYVGDANRAQQTYQGALKVDPNFYQAQTNLARLYADQGTSLADALQLAQKAKASQPDDPTVNDTLGWVYYKQGLYSSAVPLLEAAVAKSPQVAGFQFHLGLAYAASGQRAQAHTNLQTALNLGLNATDTRTAQEALQK
jgi:tetratricopeptide (TPR) repeat protein